jgi:Ser/Thr protein kinase RdoA (MazF antagonist)
VPDAAAGFSSSAVLDVLHEACRRARLSSGGAELLRFGENAIYRLAADPVVVRIARSADRLARVERELCVARWLAAASVPVVRVVDDIEQPLLIDGYPVSFWRAVTGGDPAPTHVDLARLIAAFHSLPDSPCDLPSFQPLQTSEARLATTIEIGPGDREFLRKRCADLNGQFQRLGFALPPGPIHGDAHTSNLLTDDGQVVLLDFEAVAIGPREWDLMPTAVARERFHLSEERYRGFADTYGFDVRTWAGYPVLREIRELTMTTWLMQNVGESAAVAAEFALRVASLRERDTRRVWTAF